MTGLKDRKGHIVYLFAFGELWYNESDNNQEDFYGKN